MRRLSKLRLGKTATRGQLPRGTFACHLPRRHRICRTSCEEGWLQQLLPGMNYATCSSYCIHMQGTRESQRPIPSGLVMAPEGVLLTCWDGAAFPMWLNRVYDPGLWTPTHTSWKQGRNTRHTRSRSTLHILEMLVRKRHCILCVAAPRDQQSALSLASSFSAAMTWDLRSYVVYWSA